MNITESEHEHNITGLAVRLPNTHMQVKCVKGLSTPVEELTKEPP